MNYPEILNKLKHHGITHYQINKETGIAFSTLKQLRDGVTKNPRIETHNAIMRLLQRIEGDQ